jgi:hypothetical protein
VHSPYTPNQLDALMAAETSVGIALTAIAWARPMRPRIASILLVASAWAAVLTPVTGSFFTSLGVDVGDEHLRHMIRLSSVLAAVGALFSRRKLVGFVGVVGGVVMWRVRDLILASDWDVAGGNLCLIGLLLGLQYRTTRQYHLPETNPGPAPGARPQWKDDIAIFAIAMGLGAFVATYLLHRHTNSGDEWADTYQAALFAKGRAFEEVPACAEAFRSFWVYQYQGRSFAQYTPGWPLFMAPFVWIGAVWLAAPASLGLLAVGVARLSRRAAAGFSKGTRKPSERDVRAAGWFGALALTLGSTMLINGGARYPHVFVAAMFAWSVEALFSISDPAVPKGVQWLHGAILGSCAALMVSARPADGGTLGVGLFFYFVYAAARRRIGLRAALAAFLGAALWGGLSLVILRAQLGVWFKTGYSLNAIFYPWNTVEFSWPKPDEVRASLPLASGSYCWWPCSPAIGLAGLAALRGRAQRIAFVMALSFAPFLAFYTACEIGRHSDFGYGPRYEFPTVVPMAVGTGLMVALLWGQAHRAGRAISAFRAGGPVALVLLAAVLGIVRVAPLVYPGNVTDIHDHNLLVDAIVTEKLHDAVVLAHDGIANVEAMDLPENLPLSLYTHQDVLIARQVSAESDECVRKHYGDRKIVHAEKKGSAIVFHPDAKSK